MLDGVTSGGDGASTPLLVVGTASGAGRDRVPFNEGWLFAKGDPPDLGACLTYDRIKPWLLDQARPDPPDGGPFVQPEFDDRDWRPLTLPHDWGIEGPFRPEYPGETAKLPWWGIAWYRKRFPIAASDAGRSIYLDFDGAMSFASVWINGRFAGGHPYGYSSFRVDLTPYVVPDAENVVAVRLDNPEDSSRWYPGGGIYRNVWLVKTAPAAVGHWGVRVTTPHVAAEAATVAVTVEVENRSSSMTSVRASTEIYDGDRPVGIAEASAREVPAPGKSSLGASVMVPDPHLWGLTDPFLYRAVTKVRQGEEVVDQVETHFGIRTIRFDAREGFLLNGQRTFLKGVCLHHDLGALGAAFNVRAAERQLEILQQMGCNAIRTSHNPPAPEFLDLCDRLGFLVVDEFADTWTHAKKANGYARLFADWSEIDLRSMVRRDRNHPCVVLCSPGTEIAEQVARVLVVVGNQHMPMLDGQLHCHSPRARLSKRVYSDKNTISMVPVGPFRCLATTSSTGIAPRLCSPSGGASPSPPPSSGRWMNMTTSASCSMAPDSRRSESIG